MSYIVGNLAPLFLVKKSCNVIACQNRFHHDLPCLSLAALRLSLTVIFVNFFDREIVRLLKAIFFQTRKRKNNWENCPQIWDLAV